MNKKHFYFIRLPMILMAAFFLFPSGVYAQDPADCQECHDEIMLTLMNSPHETHPVSKPEISMTATCFDCHRGWQQHLEDPSAENIQAGPELSQSKQAEICSQCHVTPHQMAMFSDDPRAKSSLTCTSCHMIHGNRNAHLVKEDLDNYCVTCHPATAAEFQQRTSHPLESANVRCVDCHDLSSIGVVEFSVGFNWKCQNCHEEKSGPFPYEHEVVYGHLVEGGTCVECHEPHGSANDRLLKQPGRPLCLQCHGMPPGHQTNHGGLGSRYDCVQCHSEIHGSYSNRLLLDPDLGEKLVPNCFQAGCHSLGNQGG